jgi:hypothetical protein
MAACGRLRQSNMHLVSVSSVCCNCSKGQRIITVMRMWFTDQHCPLLLRLLLPPAEIHADAALLRAQVAVQIRYAERAAVSTTRMCHALPPAFTVKCSILPCTHHLQSQLPLSLTASQLPSPTPCRLAQHNCSLHSGPAVRLTARHRVSLTTSQLLSCPQQLPLLLPLQAGSTQLLPTFWPRCTVYRPARTACTT